MGRALAAGASFLAAAASGALSALGAANPSVGLWVAVGVLVLVGAVLQGVVSLGERRSGQQVLASGPGSVAVGGSAGSIRTYVQGSHRMHIAADTGEVIASAPGAVSIGGDATAPVITDVTSEEEAGQHD
jgi:hypothetical protein